MEGWSEKLAIAHDAHDRFLEQHLGRWTAAMASEIRGAIPPRSYAALADWTARWVAGEAAEQNLTPAQMLPRSASLRQADEPIACDPRVVPPAAAAEGDLRSN